MPPSLGPAARLTTSQSPFSGKSSLFTAEIFGFLGNGDGLLRCEWLGKIEWSLFEGKSFRGIYLQCDRGSQRVLWTYLQLVQSSNPPILHSMNRISSPNPPDNSISRHGNISLHIRHSSSILLQPQKSIRNPHAIDIDQRVRLVKPTFLNHVYGNNGHG